MKEFLNITIGKVRIEATGHQKYIYTPGVTYREGLINLWDHEKDETRIQGGLQDLIRIAKKELASYSESFKALRNSQSLACLE